MIVNHITPPNKFTITSSDLCITRVEKLEFGKAFPECSFEWLLLMVLCNRNGLKIFFFWYISQILSEPHNKNISSTHEKEIPKMSFFTVATYTIG